jgi:hypothetical protein
MIIIENIVLHYNIIFNKIPYIPLYVDGGEAPHGAERPLHWYII